MQHENWNMLTSTDKWNKQIKLDISQQHNHN